MEAQRHTRDPNDCPKTSQVNPRCPKGSPKVPQGVPKDSKKSEKTAQSDTQAQNKVDTFSKLGFVHRRNVFEPPKPKVDYHYYVFGTLEIIILVKSVENIAPAMLLEPPEKPVLAREREARFKNESLTNILSTAIP